MFKRLPLLSITGVLAALGLALAVSPLFVTSGCSDDEDTGGVCGVAPTLSISVCDTSTGSFTNPTTIDNEFFPLAPGTSLVLEGIDDEGVSVRIEFVVTNTTEVVGGVTTRVVRETEYEDGELVEIALDYYAQNDAGTVCYLGEKVDMYEDGVIVSNEGQWRADEGTNKAGIIMPANPTPGDAYQQESAPGISEDQGVVINLGDTLNVPAGTFTDTLHIQDCNPLEPGGSKESKVFVSGIGQAFDDGIALTSYTIAN
jgi:hypothetical protein